jgi:ribosomal protein S18 acetylase RimI-like enzyme
MLTFKPLSGFERGMIFHLLKSSYHELILSYSSIQDELLKQWLSLDSEAFDHPDTVGRCVRMTCLHDRPIGMFSWDPRELPEEGIIGQNCIIPEERNRGYGKEQIRELIRLFREMNAEKISVTTATDDFFLPAQAMYRACGFKEVREDSVSKRNAFKRIRFELKLNKT